uniref:Uncharacterized protein n=1 Tax=Mycena chlorophos TaxID=658473 RepID=A0ABQ0L1M5_MYCCL|nr:predicted protein [Mycena chlorophos]
MAFACCPSERFRDRLAIAMSVSTLSDQLQGLSLELPNAHGSCIEDLGCAARKFSAFSEAISDPTCTINLDELEEGVVLEQFVILRRNHAWLKSSYASLECVVKNHESQILSMWAQFDEDMREKENAVRERNQLRWKLQQQMTETDYVSFKYNESKKKVGTLEDELLQLRRANESLIHARDEAQDEITRLTVEMGQLRA